MPFTDRLTELIAGRGLADRDERKQLERKYGDAEEKMRNIRSVHFEGASDGHSSTEGVSVRTLSEPLSTYFQKESRIRIRPTLLRTHSEIPQSVLETVRSTAGPPDITAVDLSEEKLRRTYSTDNVWDHENRMPPLPEMTGFGRYRRYKGADAEWQRHHLKRSMSNLPDHIAGTIDMLDITGTDPEIWRQYRADSQRSNSFTSACSSGSGPGAPSFVVDPKTGTLISRGFSPSNVSSAASSLRDSAVHHRKDSALSVKSSGSDSSRRLPRNGSPSALAISIAKSRSKSLIDKASKAFENEKRKLERPCHFNDAAHNDSAVASEGEDEWEDTLGTIDQSESTAMLNKQFQVSEQEFATLTKTRTRSNEPFQLKAGNKGLDRMKTVKATRPHPRRAQSNKARKADQKEKSNDRSENDLPGEGEAFESKDDQGKRSPGSSDGELYIAQSEQKSIDALVMGEDDINRYDRASNRSVSAATLVPTKTGSISIPQCTGRPRSGTAFRVASLEMVDGIDENTER